VTKQPKHSKNPKYDDPSAFGKQWPPIVEVVGEKYSPLETLGGTVRYFKMGHCEIVLREPDGQQGWFMTIRRKNHYPSWDEIVWARYNLIPDAAHMLLALPSLNSYINREEDVAHRNTFTLAQHGWHLDPAPECPVCGEMLALLEDESHTADGGTFVCRTHDTVAIVVNFNTWNEQHGNGLRAQPVAAQDSDS
jgi:hypothetical protein